MDHSKKIAYDRRSIIINRSNKYLINQPITIDHLQNIHYPRIVALNQIEDEDWNGIEMPAEQRVNSTALLSQKNVSQGFFKNEITDPNDCLVSPTSSLYPVKLS